MSAYLKRLNIDSVEEIGVETTGTAYLKRVEIVEVVDQDGRPWEPAPGPDPWDELVVSTNTTYNPDNDYTIGNTILATAATFIGGSDQVSYRCRWQRRDSEDASIVNSAWVTIDNTFNLDGISYEIVHAGQIRLQTQATDNGVDPVVTIQSFGGWKDINYAPMVVAATTVSGTPYVGETITCAQPVVSGGQAPYTYSYMWLDSNSVRSSSNSRAIGTDDLGKVLNCSVTVTSADGQTGNTTTTNGVGPIQQYTIGGIVLTNSDTDTIIENSDIETILQGASVTYVADYPGDLPQDNAVWEWKVRSGNVTIRGSSNLPYCTFELPTEFPGGCSLSVTIFGKNGENMTNETQTLLWSITYLE